jgi:hypothetical protein
VLIFFKLKPGVFDHRATLYDRSAVGDSFSTWRRSKVPGFAIAAFSVDYGATRPDFKDRMTPSFGTTCLGFPFARYARM